MKEKLKKSIFIEIGIVFIIFLLVSSFTFCIEFNNNDELWNFSNVYKMANGYTIYKDLNVIDTPLFFYIGEILFRVIGDNYLTFRIYNFIIQFFLFYLIYQIFKSLIVKRLNSIVYMIIIYLITSRVIGVGANYNCLAILFYLIGTLISLKIDKEKWYLPYIQGIITFLVFITKQNIGIFYLVGYVIYNILVALKNKNIKKEIIFLLKLIATFTFLCLVFLIHLALQNNLYNFINFCVLGLFEFGAKNIYFKANTIIILVFDAISILFSIILIYTKRANEDLINKNLIMLPVAALALLISYPIINLAHVYLGSLLLLILLIYNIDKIIIQELIEYKQIKKFYIGFILLVNIYVIVLGICNNIKFYESLSTYIDPYYGSMITKGQIEQINEVCNFIKQEEKNGIDVKIVSYRSNVYMNVLKKNNGVLDLPFYGNLGKEGEDGIINSISSMNNTKILIQKEEELFYQESEKVRKYIKENLKHEGEIADFLIYSK